MTALAFAFSFSLTGCFVVMAIHHLDQPRGGFGVFSDLMYVVIGLGGVVLTAPQLLKPCIVRLTPEFLEISRTFTLYRIPWEELEDAEVMAKGHLPFMKIRTNPPRSSWMAEMERKHGDFDLGLFWWEVGVPMKSLAKLIWLYASEASEREELRDATRTAMRFDSLRKSS